MINAGDRIAISEQNKVTPPRIKFTPANSRNKGASPEEKLWKVKKTDSPLVVQILKKETKKKRTIDSAKLSSYNPVSEPVPCKNTMEESPEPRSRECSNERDLIESSRSSTEMQLSSLDPEFRSYEHSANSFLHSSSSIVRSSISLGGCTSAYLPSTRSGTNLIERITRGRIGSKKYNKEPLRLKERSFSTPKIVKAHAKYMLRSHEAKAFVRKSQGSVQKKLMQTSPHKWNTDSAKAKAEEMKRVFRPQQFCRRIGRDIFLDNYRRHSRSPASDEFEKELKQMNVKIEKVEGRSEKDVGTARVQCVWPVRIIDRINTKELRQCADRQLIARSLSLKGSEKRDGNHRQVDGK